MSKAEFFETLESFSPEELAEVAIRVERLRHGTAPELALNDCDREALSKRFERFGQDGNSGEEWAVVRERVLSQFKK